MKNIIIKIVIALAIFLPGLIFAANMSYVPRVFIEGSTGTTKLLGEGDILAPLFLTQTNNLFAYAQGKTAYEQGHRETDTYTGGLALGFRQLVKDTVMLGGYVFGDYTTTNAGHDFWIVSPGIEALTRAWDFRANGYFPVSETRWVEEDWASSFGDYSHLRPTEHKLYDHWYQFYQETGPGGDAEVGRNLYMLKGMFKGVLFKGFVNGYYYYMKHNGDVLGGGARLTIQPNQALKISFRYSYDNEEHSTFMAGVQLSFYDLIGNNRNNPVDVQDLQRNLFVPIERNLGTIGSGSSIPITDTGDPVDSGERLLYGNAWYFRPGVSNSNAAEGTGTYKDPFINLTRDNIKYIEDHYPAIASAKFPFPHMLFNFGNYPLADFSVANEANRFELFAGWSMYGYVLYNGVTEEKNIHPATGDAYPIFIGGLLMNSDTSANNVRVKNIPNTNAPLEVGVKIINATNVTLDDVTVGNDTSMDGSYVTGTYLENSDITINNSQIFGYYPSINGNARDAKGIEAKDEGGHTITAIGGSLIEGKSLYGDGDGFGLYLDPDDAGNICLGAITGDGTAEFKGENSGYEHGCGYGAYAHTETGNIEIATIDGAKFIGEGGEGRGEGMQLEGTEILITNINNSFFEGNGTNDIGEWSAGLFVSSINGTKAEITSINNSEFKAESTSSGANGMALTHFNEIIIGTINNSKFEATGTGWQNGIYIPFEGATSIGNISNSKFIGTGGTYGFGLYLFTAKSITSIGNISNSEFIGTGGLDGCGLYVNAFEGTTSIGNITNNTFEASRIGIDLYGGTVTVNNGDDVDSGADVLDSLKNHGFINTFNVPTDQEARVNNS